MITDCESGIKEVEDILANLEIAPSQGFLPALKAASKRALYPFRRAALVGLLFVLDGLRGNLDTASALLQMYS